MLRKYLLTAVLVVFSSTLALVGSVFVYLILALITPSPLIGYSLPVLVLVGLSYGGMKFALKTGAAHHQRAALPLSLVFTLAVVSLAAFPTIREVVRQHPDPASEEVLAALRSNALPLDSVDAGYGFDDLRPLAPLLSGKRIVALGEATHGTSEFFRMKHRLVEYLVHELGFRHFGMELSQKDGAQIDRYIQGEAIDLSQVLYWPWATREVLNMLNWMREFNASVPPHQRIIFHGIDPIVGDRDPIMAQNVSRILEDSGPDAKIVLWAHNAHISKANAWMGYHLKQTWGNQAYLLGFEFDHGSFTSRMATVQTYSIGPSTSDFYAYALAKLNQPQLFLDFKTITQSPSLRSWLETPQRSHEIQEIHAIYRLNPGWFTLETSWLDLYDGIIFVAESTPAQPIQ